MNILGISAFYHDSAACLIKDGVIFAAAQQERFSPRQARSRFPARCNTILSQRGLISLRMTLITWHFMTSLYKVRETP